LGSGIKLYPSVAPRRPPPRSGGSGVDSASGKKIPAEAGIDSNSSGEEFYRTTHSWLPVALPLNPGGAVNGGTATFGGIEIGG
jgi:hypothetical protein